MRLLLGLAVSALASTAAFAQLPTTGFRAVEYEPALRSQNKPAGTWSDLRCTILQQKDDWAWIHSPEGKEGWVRSDEVVPLDRAADFFTQRIASDPENPFWRQSRANVRQELGELDAALDDLTEAIRRQANNEDLFNNRAVIYEAKREYDLAIADYNAALKLNPNEPVYWANAAATRLKMKDFAKAMANCDRAISLDAAFPVPYRIRARAWAFQGDRERAIADYTTAAELDPSEPSSYASPAWTRATCPVEACRDGKKAVELARYACGLSQWKDSWCLDVLAAAYAESGDFDSAIKYARQSLDLATGADRDEISRRLKLYAAKTPYRDD
jgi:tetratricopeptide (TPR) repeat protein